MKIWAADEPAYAVDLNKNFEDVLRNYIQAGEAMTGATLPQPVFVEDGVYTGKVVSSNSSGLYMAQLWGSYEYAMLFTTSSDINRLLSITLNLAKSGSPSGNIIVAIYAVSGGLPTGSALGSISIPVSNITGGDNIFNFSTPLAVSPSTNYMIVVSVPSGNGSNYIGWYYANGGSAAQSNDGGSTWSGYGVSFRYSVKGVMWHATGSAVLSGANDADRIKFHGFAVSDASVDALVAIQMIGVVNGFTGLTIGAKYYVQNTNGTIGTSPGATSILVGIAVSATALQIEKDITKL